MLNRDTLELIQATARKAHAVERIDHPDPRKIVYRVGEKTVEYEAAPPLRKHTVFALADLCAYVDQCNNRFHSLAGAIREAVDEDGQPVDVEPVPSPVGPPVLWHSRQAVVLVTNDNDRLDTVRLPLLFSDQFAALEGLRGTKQFSQRELIRYLRFRVGATLEQIAPFRKIDWSTGEKASATITRGKESLGAQIQAEVAGLSEIPETLTFRVPVYALPDPLEPIPVTLLIEPEPRDQAFAVQVEPDGIAGAIDAAQDDIHRRIVEHLNGPANPAAAAPHWQPVAVYYGTP